MDDRVDVGSPEKRPREPEKNADRENEVEPHQKKGTITREVGWHARRISQFA
jgi:hypothetical protein